MNVVSLDLLDIKKMSARKREIGRERNRERREEDDNLSTFNFHKIPSILSIAKKKKCENDRIFVVPSVIHAIFKFLSKKSGEKEHGNTC